MAHRQDAIVITDAQEGRSADLDARSRRYLWAMGVRVACFALMLVVPGWWKVVCLVGAGLIPAVGVLLANAQEGRHDNAHALPNAMLPAPDADPGDVIVGEVVDDSPSGVR